MEREEKEDKTAWMTFGHLEEKIARPRMSGGIWCLTREMEALMRAQKNKK